MSWSIPTKIEADIQSGLADYRTFQTGMGGQTVMKVPPNSYVVIFGMDYQPSGGGITYVEQENEAEGAYAMKKNFGVGQNTFNDFGTQQVSFWTGNQFYPFIFHAPIKLGGVVADAPSAGQMLLCTYIDSSPISRSLYIPSTNDVAITVGLIRSVVQNTTALIPVSQETPEGLTYGGFLSAINVQSDFNSTFGQTTQFLQPNPQLFQTLGFGLPPAGQSDQAFAKPAANQGLDDATRLLTVGGFVSVAASNYFLTLHYALYNSAPNERLL